MSERVELPLSDGSALICRVFAKPAARRAPRLVFSHGLGLACGAYDAFIAALARGFNVIAVDLRGHGESVGALLPEHRVVERMTDDMADIRAAIDRQFGAAPTAGVFHSISGILALRHALRDDGAWSALALLDPPLSPPEGHALMPAKRRGTSIMVAKTERRRSRFPSAAAYAAELRRRPEFAGWIAGAHLRFAEATTCPDADGDGVTLRLPPAREADIYRENVLPELGDGLFRLPVPVRLICSDPEGPYASPVPALCRALGEEAGIGVEILRGTTHMLPLEQPAECARAVAGFLSGCGMPPGQPL